MTKPVYLDNAATTPVRSDVLEAMLPYLSEETFGNPSSAHGFGRTAREGVERARRQVAEAIGAEPSQVVFTSGGTESDNLAVVGGALAAREAGRPFRVAASSIEHPAVTNAAIAVESMGGEMISLPVDQSGQVDPDAFDAALQRGLGLASVMWVNNEVGFVQDLADLADRARRAGTVFHTDAVQAIAKIPCTVDEAPWDLLSISGHKIGAPKGIGALIVRDRKLVRATAFGGGQEFAVRPGTENVAGIVGLGVAAERGVREQPDTAARLRALRDTFERGLAAALPDAVIVARDGHRAPHISCVAIPGIDGEATVMHLDLAGIACSTGSACHTGTVEPSRVLTAMGVPTDLAVRALRFSLSKQSTADDVNRALTVLPDVVNKVRRLASTLGR
jgi:cysteine desulfurase